MSGRPRTIVRMDRAFLVLLTAASGGCLNFDNAGVSGDGKDPDCPQAISVALAINGQPVDLDGDRTPPRVLVGDTVSLSAAGSCVRTGDLAVSWEFDEPLLETASAALDSSEISVFPLDSGPHDVELTVRDGSGDEREIELVAFEAVGWVRLDYFGDTNNNEHVRGMATDGTTLYMSTDRGLFTAPLTAPIGSPYQTIDGSIAGDPIDDTVEALHHDAAGNLLWVGTKSSSATAVWRIELAAAPPQSTRFALPLASKVDDFATTAGSVWIASSNALYASFAGQPVNELVSGEFAAVLATVSDDIWAGTKDELLSLDATVMPVDVFPDNEDKISSLVADGGQLWIASDGQGVARFDPDSAMITPYTDREGLPNNRVRALAIETEGPFAGDIWAATNGGIARFKKDRGLWITVDRNGSSGRNDVRSITARNTEAGRVIYAGSSSGLIYLGTP